MSEHIKKGTRVAFSRTFLRNTGSLTDGKPFARGTVTSIEVFDDNFTLAEVAWDEGFESSVNIKNLVAEDRIHLET